MIEIKRRGKSEESYYGLHCSFGFVFQLSNQQPIFTVNKSWYFNDLFFDPIIKLLQALRMKIQFGQLYYNVFLYLE